VPEFRRVEGEIFNFYVVADDDGTGHDEIHECNEDNNVSAPWTTDCPGID
jgi:hypothetical protein